MFSDNIINGTQEFTMVPKIMVKVASGPFFWTLKMMKIDHTIKCVKKFGYHLGTILGTIWVPFDILGTIGVPSWVPGGIFVCYKNRDFLKF